MHLCKCNDVADLHALPMCYNAEFGRSALKDVNIAVAVATAVLLVWGRDWSPKNKAPSQGLKCGRVARVGNRP